MPFNFEGNVFSPVHHTQMSPKEIGKVERATGLTYKKIRYLADTCVCEHPMAKHFHFGDDQRLLNDTSCVMEGCRCSGFNADLPNEVEYAFLWVALLRVAPDVRFEDLCEVPQSEMRFEAEDASGDDGDPDPTQPSEPEE